MSRPQATKNVTSGMSSCVTCQITFAPYSAFSEGTGERDRCERPQSGQTLAFCYSPVKFVWKILWRRFGSQEIRKRWECGTKTTITLRTPACGIMSEPEILRQLTSPKC